MELRGWRRVWHDLHSREEDGARVYACPFNTLKVENRRELEPNTAIHVVLLQATRKQWGTNSVMSVTFSRHHPVPDQRRCNAGLPVGDVGHQGWRNDPLLRIEMSSCAETDSACRGVVRHLDCNVRVTIWALAPFALGIHSARRLLVPPAGRSQAKAGVVCARLRWGLLVPLLVEILLGGNKLSRGRSRCAFTFFSQKRSPSEQRVPAGDVFQGAN